MGLDIYLRRYTDKAEYDRVNDEFEARTSALWESICGVGDQKPTEEQTGRYNAERLKVAQELGCEPWGELPELKHNIELPSAIDPEHYFKVGYFRSSYNDSGIERITENLIGKRALHFIFEPGDEYEFQPDWRACRARAVAVHREFVETIEKQGPYRVIRKGYNEFLGLPNNHPIKSERDALAAFVRTKEEDRRRASSEDSTRWFSNRDGDFFLGKPIQIEALITGVERRFFVDEFLPCTYAVYRDDEGFAWYEKALRIVIETCDWAIENDPSTLWLAWSG